MAQIWTDFPPQGGAYGSVSEQKNDIPLVRLGDVAKWLRPGDRFLHRDSRGHGGECCISDIGESWVSCTGVFRGVGFSQLVTLISPRLELVPVGGVVKAGTPYAYLDGSEWTDFEPPVKDFANPSADCYQLTRDEPEQLPREVVAGPETLPRRVLGSELRPGDRFRFAECPMTSSNEVAVWSTLSPDGTFVVTERMRTRAGWHSAPRAGVYDERTVELLSRANQDPPAAEAQPEAVAPRLPSECCFCEQPFWEGRPRARNPYVCADCSPVHIRGPLDARIATARRELAEAASDPHAHLTPAQRYHLLDDPDATGIPEGN